MKIKKICNVSLLNFEYILNDFREKHFVIGYEYNALSEILIINYVDRSK